MEGGVAVENGGSATLQPSAAAADQLSSQPLSHDGVDKRPQEAVVSSSDRPPHDESGASHETGGRSCLAAGVGDADLDIVNEKLRAENEAFRWTIDTNVSLKNNINHLESTAEELEACKKTLLAQLEDVKQRSDEQAKQIRELETSLAAAKGRHSDGAAEGEIGVQQQHYGSDSDSYEQKGKDLVALISQLNEDAKAKALLLEKKEAQLREKQALYEDLKKKHGLQDVPSAHSVQIASSDTRNPSSRSCLVM